MSICNRQRGVRSGVKHPSKSNGAYVSEYSSNEICNDVYMQSTERHLKCVKHPNRCNSASVSECLAMRLVAVSVCVAILQAALIASFYGLFVAGYYVIDVWYMI